MMAQSPAASYASGPPGSFDFGHRLEAFRRSDRERDQLMEELIKAYQNLDSKLQETTSDLANEQQSRREWQRQAQHAQEQFNRTSHAQGTAPFVLALIDGDGAPFLDELYTKGEDGGKQAAYLLDQELRKQIAAMHPNENTAHWDIIVNVFVNMDGLTKKLRACGLLNYGADMSVFAQSFGRQLFQFVDVGFGKERADYKLREWFRLFVNNVQCKHIVLGGICHDNGYLPMLDPYVHDPMQHVRISFLATLPAQPAFKSMLFRPIRVNNVFRQEHLASKPIAAPNGSLPNGGINRKASLESGVSLPVRTATHDKADSIISPPLTTTPSVSGVSITSPSPAPTENGSTASWARVSKPVDSSQKEFQVAGKKPPPTKYILCNKANERLDAPIPQPDKASQDKLFRRVKEHGKVCNNYHLAGKCPGKCGFIHGEKLVGAELSALRFRARTRACNDGLACEDYDCTCGHVCPFGDACYGDNCAFESTHNIDLTPAIKYYKDGRMDILH
ncbi:C-x8-C-x5-C-x3-H type zinc finger protein [Elsinoe ampelina]|uniref:C-x8-C-x5-C-x3-H type zinc finger protein n=1 Tax=Elsinoe ampelina TaxID=302913 RepID=A0A6A6GKA7_9PEZI|nr:C-x8-C-x5-C-x3-H type zinc finger protein [Elsinoe ampelina]